MSCDSSRSRWAFSLVEVLVVIVIIGLLAGAVTINVRNYLVKAKQSRARQDIAMLMDALDRYWSEYGRYPTNEEALVLLTKPTDKMPDPPLRGMGEPKDSWGKPYLYNCPGANWAFEVICLGADGQIDTVALLAAIWAAAQAVFIRAGITNDVAKAKE